MNKSKIKIKNFAEKNKLGLIISKKDNYILKEGSTFVYILVNEDEGGEWIVFYSLVVKNAKKSKKLMIELLELNSSLPFGAFGFRDEYIVFKHCILGGDHMDEEEFLQSLYSVAKIADKYDNDIQKKYGGKRAMDVLLEDLLDNK
jgi:type III secretion system-like peptide-binding chaperone